MSDQGNILEHKSYREVLKAHLAERQSVNRAYSLRAFARDLGLAPSYLSDVHNGKRALTSEGAVKIATKLSLNSRNSEYFQLLVALENAKSPETKSPILDRLRSFETTKRPQDWSVDCFKTIADWYHLPLLELSDLADFKLTAESAAKKLGITKLEAQVAIERLMRIELLTKTEDGFYLKAADDYHFGTKVPGSALTKFHSQMILKAQQSLDSQLPGERYTGSETFSIDPEQFEDAKRILTECREKLNALFKTGKKKSEVYHLGLQLFRVTQKEDK